jgi:serine-type D-Ala-D-Ala carboxypeptidase (penicillin-binding protein 5/6)
MPNSQHVYGSVGPRRDYRAGRGRKLRRFLLVAAAMVAVAVVLAQVGRLGGSGAGTAAVVHTPGPGKGFDLAWPGEGQATVAVPGLGNIGVAGGQEPVPIASLAKVMTAYLVLRDNPLGPGEEGFEMTIGPAEVAELHERTALGQSVVPVEAGEVLSERQALEALLLPSANNVAALLAVHEAGSVEAFAAEMNDAAGELGMSHTHYTDPSGFEDSTVSTAVDQLKIGRAAMADPTFREIVALPAAVLPVAGEVVNFNALVGREGFIGIKTGSDQAAGGCLLFARHAEVDGRRRTVFGAVLGQRGDDLVEAALASARDLADSVSR